MVSTIHINDIHHFYNGDLKLVANLVIDHNKSLLEGPNGIGKSTLLRLTAQLEQPTRGEISFSPSPQPVVSIASDSVDMPALFSVAEIIQLVKKFKRFDDQEFEQHASTVGLLQFLPSKVGDLSTGNKKKLQLLLALCSHHDVLLLDEPFNGLDKSTIDYFWTLLCDHNKILIMVDHQLSDSKRQWFKTIALD